MATPFISSNVLVWSMVYSEVTCEMTYVFLVDGVEFSLVGRLHESGGIRGVECSDELEGFLMSLMPFDHGVSKKLSAISWNYVDGGNVEFPISLVAL